jgi:hypothetical protein
MAWALDRDKLLAAFKNMNLEGATDAPKNPR